jgi:UDP-N-acetylmuramoylalanine--D-glutamate ligase
MNNKSLKHLPKKAAVIGAARSGIAAAQYLIEKGVSVFISDSCKQEKLEKILKDNNLSAIAHESDGHTDQILKNDVIILSPGVSSDLPILQKARAKNIPIWSEIELGFRQSDAKWLAITGSSGKSTTTSLLGAIMEADGRGSVVAGNIGTPVISLAPGVKKDGVVVAEVSSFQLETIDAFKPWVAAILNLMKNHLDRYRSELEYYEAKKNIIKNMDSGSHLIINANDEILRPWALGLKSKINLVFFGRKMEGFPSVWFDNGHLYGSMDKAVTDILSVSKMKLEGPHNYENASAAAAMALAAGASYENIVKGLTSFAGLPHRLEYAGEINNVRFFNDSKSTTAESVLCAVTAFGNNVHLIAGGRDKGCDFSVVKNSLRERVKDVVLIGEAADRMESEWKNDTTILRASSLKQAMETALIRSVKGDVVVLSPGCSSFDMFRDFEDRGRKFIELVKELSANSKSSKKILKP